MKTIKFLALALLLAATSSTVMAQKLATIKSNAVMEKMMVKDSVQMKFEAHATELTQEAQAMQTEFNKRLSEFQNAEAGMSEVVRAQKEKELTQLAQNIEQFNVTMQQSQQQKQQELINPIVTKLREAAAKVGAAGGYAMIFDGDTQLYVNPSLVTDITTQVEKELGL